MVELYHHFPILLHGVVHIWLSTGTLRLLLYSLSSVGSKTSETNLTSVPLICFQGVLFRYRVNFTLGNMGPDPQITYLMFIVCKGLSLYSGLDPRTEVTASRRLV
jgi:hypothetical protein